MRTNTFIPLAIVLFGTACAFMSAGAPNPTLFVLSLCVLSAGVMAHIIETNGNKQ